MYKIQAFHIERLEIHAMSIRYLMQTWQELDDFLLFSPHISLSSWIHGCNPLSMRITCNQQGNIQQPFHNNLYYFRLLIVTSFT